VNRKRGLLRAEDSAGIPRGFEFMSSEISGRGHFSLNCPFAVHRSGRSVDFAALATKPRDRKLSGGRSGMSPSVTRIVIRDTFVVNWLSCLSCRSFQSNVLKSSFAGFRFRFRNGPPRLPKLSCRVRTDDQSGQKEEIVVEGAFFPGRKLEQPHSGFDCALDIPDQPRPRLSGTS
jgi:hypothetical protein